MAVLGKGEADLKAWRSDCVEATFGKTLRGQRGDEVGNDSLRRIYRCATLCQPHHKILDGRIVLPSIADIGDG
jgi:hypothetical protein